MTFTRQEKIEEMYHQRMLMSVKDVQSKEFLKEEEKKKKWTFTLIGRVHVMFPHLER